MCATDKNSEKEPFLVLYFQNFQLGYTLLTPLLAFNSEVVNVSTRNS